MSARQSFSPPDEKNPMDGFDIVEPLRLDRDSGKIVVSKDGKLVQSGARLTTMGEVRAWLAGVRYGREVYGTDVG